MEKKTAEVFAGLVSFISESGLHADCIEYLLSKGIAAECIRDAFNNSMQVAKCADRFTVQDCSSQ